MDYRSLALLIRDRIRTNSIALLLDELSQVQLGNNEWDTILMTLKAEYQDYEKSKMLSLLSVEQEDLFENRYRYRLIKLSNKIIDELKEKFYSDEETCFSNEIVEEFRLMDEIIERLTKEQYRIIDFLSFIKRARISGCAGSGKTLVAIEKAFRCASAGKKTLFLCHSPLLADFIYSILMENTNVDVYAFEDFINELNEKKSLNRNTWNNYSEPLKTDLDFSKKQIQKSGINYEVLIVDEGQDFRANWWDIAKLLIGREGEFYIFHDDSQALLPGRASYPITEPLLNLSRNCRNGGEIFTYIKEKYIDEDVSPADELNNKGILKIHELSEEENIYDSTLYALHWMKTVCQFSNIKILLSGGLNEDNWKYGLHSLTTMAGYDWREEVFKIASPFSNRYSKYNSSHLRSRLSFEDIPSDDDFKIINDYFRDIVDKIKRKKGLPDIIERVFFAITDLVRWTADKAGKLHLAFNENSHYFKYLQEATITEQNIAKVCFLSRFYDTNQFYTQYNVEFTREENSRKNTITVRNASVYKGLESNGVILVSVGKSFLNERHLYVGASRAKKCLYVINGDQ